MVYQDLSLCDTIDVAGNLLLGREPQTSHPGLVRSWTRPRCTGMPAPCSSGSASGSPNTRLKVENLSGGQRQSIAIGRAASFDPLVLIMDEPTAALAVAEVDAVLELIRKVSAQGRQRDPDHPSAAGPVPRLRPYHGDVWGRNVAERLIGETNIEEMVNLIVGRKFQLRSPARGRRTRGRRRRVEPPANACAGTSRPTPRQWRRRQHCRSSSSWWLPAVLVRHRYIS